MFCNRAKEFLSQHAVAFEEKDVTKDEAALKELEKVGVMTTPVILAGEEIIVGFDRARLAKLLEIG